MMPKTDGHCRCLWRVMGLGGLMLAGVSLVGVAFGVRINTSYSLPMGLYVATTDPSAELIEFCPEGTFARQSGERGYRTRGFSCNDGAVPLLKPIVAWERDLVETTVSGVVVNGVLLPRTAPLRFDAHARELSPWPFGLYRVEPGTVWVASTYHRGSYDSRYMGPISTFQIRRRLRALWTLGK